MNNSRTTTSPHNPLYVQHRWYWMLQPHTWQPLSMCCQNSIRGWPENSPVCNWGIQYHLYTAWCWLPDIQVSIFCTVYVLFVEWAISEVNYMHVVSQQGYILFVGTVMNICWVCSVKKQKQTKLFWYLTLPLSVLGLHLIPPPNKVSLQEQPVFELLSGMDKGGQASRLAAHGTRRANRVNSRLAII